MRSHVAVVVGGGSGVGSGVAAALADAGATVVVADVEPTAFDVAERVGGSALQVDAADRDDLRALADHMSTVYGQVNVLVNTTGAILSRPLTEATDDDWHWMVESNVYTQVRTVDELLPLIRSAPGRRHVVTTAALAGFGAPAPGLGLYSAVKHAVVGYTDSLRRELAPEGIGVSLLVPHRVRGDLANSSLRSRERAQPGRTDEPVHPPTDDLTPPAEIGPAVVDAILRDQPYVLPHRPDLAPLRRGIAELLDN